MKKTYYKKKITQAMMSVGTYKEDFQMVVDTLAGILEQRDAAYDHYVSSGGRPTVEHTNKAGATNIAKNPTLNIWSDLNTQALRFWRDLGLTPSGLRKINEERLGTPQGSKLASIINGLEV